MDRYLAEDIIGKRWRIVPKIQDDGPIKWLSWSDIGWEDPNMSGIGKRPIISNKFNKPSKKKIVNRRVSTCTSCRRGIFEGQERKWTKIGLIHTECEDNESTNAA